MTLESDTCPACGRMVPEGRQCGPSQVQECANMFGTTFDREEDARLATRQEFAEDER